MAAIVIQIVTGPGTSRREVFEESPLSFGREGSNEIILAEPTASRQHGELHFEEGQWVLVNLSPNGTWVNGRKITRKPCVLHHQDVVSVGDRPIFQIFLESAAPASEEPAPVVAAASSTTSRRAKIWTIIAIYLVFMTGLFIVLLTLTGHADSEAAPAPELTPEQIRQAILEPEKAAVVDPRKSQQYLDAATQLFNKLETSPANLYRAYNAYQMALAYSGHNYFPDGLDQRRYLQLQDNLIQQVIRLYAEGYARLRSRQYREAEATMRKLVQDVYPDSKSPVYRNVELQRSAAAEGLKRRKH